jgi:hypothetical protein
MFQSVDAGRLPLQCKGALKSGWVAPFMACNDFSGISQIFLVSFPRIDLLIKRQGAAGLLRRSTFP